MFSRSLAFAVVVMTEVLVCGQARAQERFYPNYYGLSDLDYCWQFAGTAWYKDEPVKRPFKEIAAAAEAGDVIAIRTLAIAYRDGRGVTQDLKRAAELMRKAADGDDSLALLCMFHAYRDGLGVEKDHKKAKETADRLLEIAVPIGKYATGICLFEGLGTPKNVVKGLTLCKESADSGFRSAMMWRGERALKGDGVTKSPRQALACYQQGADNGDRDGMWFTASMMLTGAGHSADGNDVKPNPKEAERYLSLAVQYDHPVACHWTARRLILRKSQKEGVEAMKHAARIGSSDAMADMALMLISGSCVAQDKEAGIRLLKEAVARNNSGAENVLGIAYLEGIGIAKDVAKAKELFEKVSEKQAKRASDFDRAWDLKAKAAAERIGAVADRSLGMLYMEGNDFPIDYKKAATYLSRARGNDRMAATLYGVMLQNGWAGNSNGSNPTYVIKDAYKLAVDHVANESPADPAAEALAKRCLLVLDGENPPSFTEKSAMDHLCSLGLSHQGPTDEFRARVRFELQTESHLAAFGAGVWREK